MLYSIQALRFLAAMAVVQFHGWPLPSTIHVGAAGVDVFFVISGLVIGLTPADESSGRFLLKRLIRIMPLYWVATLVCIAFNFYAWRFDGLPTLEAFWRSMFLIKDSSPDWHPIYFPAWTLAYEMVFYFLYALVLPFAKSRTNFVCAAIVATVSFTDVLGLSTGLLLEFAAGLMLSEMVKRQIRFPPWLGMLALAIAVWFFIVFYHVHSYPRQFVWGIPSFLIVLGFIALEKYSVFQARFVQFGGAASYAIYLVHITVQSYLLEASKWRNVPALDHPMLTMIVAIFASMLLGMAFHRWIERPMLVWLRRWVRPSERSKISSGLNDAPIARHVNDHSDADYRWSALIATAGLDAAATNAWCSANNVDPAALARWERKVRAALENTHGPGDAEER